MYPPLPQGALLTLADADRSPLSIRAKALVFIDPRSQRLHQELQSLGATAVAVLIQGETGSGKELLARELHRASQCSGLFVAVNCGALGGAQAEALLFGHAAGRAPASAAGRTGWVGSAHGGTLYLDEIADLPRRLQQQLLSVLQTGLIQRVGVAQPTPVNARLIAATSIDLARAVWAGTFSAELFEFLNAGFIALPPLRQRPADILPLAEYFLAMYAQRLELPVPVISEAAASLLRQHRWPGNTRELENTLHFALLVSRNGVITPDSLNLPATL